MHERTLRGCVSFPKSAAISQLSARYRPVFSLLVPYRKAILQLFGLGIGIQLLSVTIPYLTGILINQAYPSRRISLTYALVSASIALMVSAALLRIIHSTSSRRLELSLAVSSTHRVFQHIVGLPLSLVETARPGELASVFESLRAATSGTVTLSFTLAANLAFLVVIPPLMFFTNVPLAVIALVLMPPICYATYKQSSGAHALTKQFLECNANLRGFQTESFSSLRTIKGGQLEEYVNASLIGLTDKQREIQQARFERNREYGLLLTALRMLGVCSCIGVGWTLIVSQRLSLGSYIAFSAYLNYLYTPLQDVINAAIALEEALGSCEQLGRYLGTEPEQQTWKAGGGHHRGMLEGDIVFEDVSFGYMCSKPILVAVNGTFPNNQLIALTGPSGVGKTTLLRLIAGFDSPTSGLIKIGSMPLSDIDLARLRSHVSVIWQDSSVFSGSLWDNLTVGRLHSKREVEHVVGLCCLEDVIASMPDGYASTIGERGRKVSAGEKQRILIARMLLRASPVMLFDEATAHLDQGIHRLILGRMKQWYRSHQIIHVTHHPDCNLWATSVMEFKNGSVLAHTHVSEAEKLKECCDARAGAKA